MDIRKNPKVFSVNYSLNDLYTTKTQSKCPGELIVLLPMHGTMSLFFRKARSEIVKLVLILWTVLAAFIKLSVVPM